MDELAQSLAAFEAWDWACVVANLAVALAGFFALKCWRGLGGEEAPSEASAADAALAAGAALLCFGVVFGVVTQLVAEAFSTHFGISQAHVFTAAFAGQVAAAATMAGLGMAAPRSLAWAPSWRSANPAPVGPFRQALAAVTFPRVLLALLGIFALGLVATLAWKGVHAAWEQCFLRGWSGQPPADEPQEIVDAVLKTDVDTWRFGTIVLAVVFGAPVMEELAFRGMLYPGLRRLGTLVSARHARWIAVATTGALFSAAHLSPSAALPLFAFGAFMCLVRDRYGLLACMAVHCSFNLWNLVWLKLAPNASTL